jgi:hypothetical protein
VDERPDDPERAEEEIRSVFAQVFTGHHADAEVLAGVHDGLSLAGVLAEARAQQPDATSSARVDVAEVRFLSRTRAAVAFRIGWSLERGPRGGTRGHVLPFARRRAQLDSGATFAGTAVLVDGAWKVSRSSYCDVLRLTGAQC